MPQLCGNSFGNLGRNGSHPRDMLVRFSTVLPSPDQHNRRSKEARVPDEAAGITDGAAGIGQYLEIVLGRQVRQGPQPTRASMIPEETNRLTDVI